MSDGVTNSPEVSLALQGETLRSKEASSKGITLFKNRDVEGLVPRKPNVPLDEGIDIRIEARESIRGAKKTLCEFFYGLAVAKVVAESGHTPDEPWANTRIGNSFAGDPDAVDVYGRNAHSPDAWRKPVDVNNRNVGEIDTLEPHYDQERLTALLGRYMPKWETLARNMKLFPDGIAEIQGQIPQASTTVWENDRFRVSVNAEPHLKGLHLLIDPKEKIARQWQTVLETQENVRNQEMVQTYIQQVMEAAAISLSVRQLLFEGKGEIHNSGNWAGGLKDVSEGGTLSKENLTKDPRGEKRSHRPDLNLKDKDFGTAVHFHVYVPENPDAPVTLPVMSKGEAQERGRLDVVKQWEEIPQTDMASVLDIRKKLGSRKLTQWLLDEAKGPLI